MTTRSPTTVSAVPPTGEARPGRGRRRPTPSPTCQLARLSSLEPEESNEVALPL